MSGHLLFPYLDLKAAQCCYFLQIVGCFSWVCKDRDEAVGWLFCLCLASDDFSSFTVRLQKHLSHRQIRRNLGSLDAQSKIPKDNICEVSPRLDLLNLSPQLSVRPWQQWNHNEGKWYTGVFSWEFPEWFTFSPRRGQIQINEGTQFWSYIRVWLPVLE